MLKPCVVVRAGGVEPPRVTPLEPKSSASANSATLAYSPAGVSKVNCPCKRLLEENHLELREKRSESPQRGYSLTFLQAFCNLKASITSSQGFYMSVTHDFLANIQMEKKAQFDAQRTVLSFNEYLEEVMEAPERHIRNSAQYFLDMVRHFGFELRNCPTGEERRFGLFDCEADAGEGRVVGQERVQNSIFRLMKNFVRAGKTDRLILLHGPNGSAKTSLIQAIGRGAELYSQTDDGVLYRFNWVFPFDKIQKGALGFGGEGSKESGSFAHLPADDVEARLPCEHKDHPLLLLGAKERCGFIERIQKSGKLPEHSTIPQYLISGDLSSKNRKIFDALWVAYGGEILQVLQHVQVERFYLSRRYRRGIATVEPQMSVDARIQQVAADLSVASLPKALQHVDLFSTGGSLSDANRGLLEFNDLLKRPVDHWKYLLVASEQGQASLDPVNIFFDMLMLASSNDIHLNAFKEYPDWQSFKARFELVTVPYLLRASDEEKIYSQQIPKALSNIHIAPHTIEVAARFAVLTRLEPPDPERYPREVRRVISSLTPMEKLRIYDKGVVPERLSQKDRREVQKHVPDLYHEFDNAVAYEGSDGASPREIRAVLLNAAQDPRFDHLSPIAVLDELRALLKEKSSYAFLNRAVVRGYRDAVAFVEQTEKAYLRELEDEIRQAMGLVEADSHGRLFERYIRHVSAWTKKEKLVDPITGEEGEAQEQIMQKVEKVLLASNEKSEDFRRSLISQIGAFRLEQPDKEVDYDHLFGSYLHRLKEDYYAQKNSQVSKMQGYFLRMLEDDVTDIDPKDLALVTQMRTRLQEMGYTEESAKHSLSFLMSKQLNS